MTNFDTLTMGEKYTASKDLLMRVKAVKNLKPNFSSRDVLKAVASKFYGNDVRFVNGCVNFIKNECGDFSTLDELVDVPLDEKAQAFIDGLKNDVKNKEKIYNEKKSEKETKSKALKSAQEKRNNAQDAINQVERKEAWKDVIKMLLLGAVLLLGVGAIISAGGIMGAAGGIAGFISNLTFTQQFSLLFVGFIGVSIYNNFIKAKKGKDPSKTWKGKREKAKKDEMGKLSANLQKSKESIDTLQAEVASCETEVTTAESELNKARRIESSETANMAHYRKTSEIDVQIDAGVNELSVKYAEKKDDMNRNNASEEELSNLDNCYYHHVGKLYLDASLNRLSTKAEIDARIAMAKLALDQVSNPLSMNVNNSYDESLDDMFASI